MPVVERQSGGGGTFLAVGCAIAGAVVLLLVLLGLFGFVGMRTMVTAGPPRAPVAARMSGSGNWGTTSEQAQAIPDSPNSSGATHTFTVQNAGSPNAIATAVKLKLELAHSRPADLEVKLWHPDGTVVTLRRPGTPGQLNASYPDIDSPAESLAQLQGKPVTCKWKVTVRDTRKEHQGSLKSVGLDLNYSF